MATKKAAAPKLAPLPFGILKTDLDYPQWKDKATAKERKDRQVIKTITLHHIDSERDAKNDGWVVATLPIGGKRRPGYIDRTYAIGLDRKVYTVGQGPHVTGTVHVYVTNARAKALAPLLELHTFGEAEAGMIRDRISSRRAQGQLYRAEGRRSWTW
jgi:hypothetical protein